MMTWSCIPWGLSCRAERDRPYRAHPRRSAARSNSSFRGRGVSIRRLSRWYGGPAHCASANTALGGRRASVRRIWPSQGCLRVRIRRSYECLLAFSRYDLPVMRCSSYRVEALERCQRSYLGVSIHASLPCVRVEQKHAA